MRILVTGGAGYVGSHCVRALCDADHEVVVFDNLTAGYPQAVDGRAAFVNGDLAAAGQLEGVFVGGGFEAVMHFAALADVGESVREPLRYYENNLVSSLRLVETMKRHEVRNIVFSSSCAVYGVPPEVPITEDAPKVPISPYGRSKVAIEWVIQDCARAWGLAGTALRYFNAAGAASDGTIGEAHQPEGHLIPCLLQVALGQADHVRIFGTDYPTSDGTCIRDYVHVEDLASIHRLAVESQKTSRFRAYNVGTGRGTSVQELLEAARRITGSLIRSVPVARRAGDPPALFADTSKAERELGWRARFTDIGSIVESAWKWHRTHPNGFEEVG